MGLSHSEVKVDGLISDQEGESIRRERNGRVRLTIKFQLLCVAGKR